MIGDALYAYLHFAAILVLASALGAEALLLRAEPGPQTLRALGRADLLYGLSAAVVLVSGLLRLYLGAKGAGFYAVNPVFWVKMALFATVAAISVPATVRIVRWQRGLKTNPGYVPLKTEIDATRRWVFWELHLLALVPLAAVFMARGLGA